jgi:hypothetical protein
MKYFNSLNQYRKSLMEQVVEEYGINTIHSLGNQRLLKINQFGVITIVDEKFARGSESLVNLTTDDMVAYVEMLPKI